MNKLTITHNAGFFSCCTIRLLEIINYFNNNYYLPDIVDSSKQFELYKNNNEDITNYFFNSKDEIGINYTKDILLINEKLEEQFSNYKKINFNDINLFIEKYFCISINILDLIEKLKNKYYINYNNTLSVFYRGNDKIKETSIASYYEFVSKIKEVLALNNYERILIQTDDNLFLEFCLNDNSLKDKIFYFNELPRINNDPNLAIHHIIEPQNKKIFAAYFLAVTYLISKTKGIITHSGNCGLWAILFRGNTKDVYQYLNNKWY